MDTRRRADRPEMPPPPQLRADNTGSIVEGMLTVLAKLLSDQRAIQTGQV